MDDKVRAGVVAALRGVSVGLNTGSGLLADPAGKAVTGAIGLVAGWVADLIEHGMNPDEALEEMKGVMEDYLAAKKRLGERIDQLSGGSGE